MGPLEAVGVAVGAGGTPSAASPAGYPACPWVFIGVCRVEPFEKAPDNQGEFDNLTADMNNYSNQFAELVVSYE